MRLRSSETSSGREEALEKENSEKDKAFQKTLQDVSEDWEASGVGQKRERTGGVDPEDGEDGSRALEMFVFPTSVKRFTF